MDLEDLESLERAVHEIEALESIYGRDDDADERGNGGGFSILSEAELLAARSALASAANGDGDGGERGAAAAAAAAAVPRLEVELRLELFGDDLSGPIEGAPAARAAVARLRFGLPTGYPERAAAAVSVVSVDGMRRGARDDLSAWLTRRAEALIGTEAVMELAQELRDIAPEVAARHRAGDESKAGEALLPAAAAAAADSGFGRRWIWVHHIKDVGRQKDIVKEARNFTLGGFLKPGYPGIVVVEGEARACDDFVTWIKGSKSRPGGFGRNWGHHVRGEVATPAGMRQLPANFEQLDDCMGTLGTVCKEHGLEAEFLDYVMQHRGSGDD